MSDAVLITLIITVGVVLTAGIASLSEMFGKKK